MHVGRHIVPHGVQTVRDLIEVVADRDELDEQGRISGGGAFDDTRRHTAGLGDLTQVRRNCHAGLVGFGLDQGTFGTAHLRRQRRLPAHEFIDAWTTLATRE